MSLTMLTGLILFAFVSSITPGPNNMMLLASGANFGLRRTVPHMMGVSLGFGFLALVVGFCVAGVVRALPMLYEALRWGGAAYLLYLAFKIATAKGLGSKDGSGRPLTFLQAAAFQWINPKALAMALVAVGAYATPDHLALDVVLIGLVLVVVGLPCIASWAAFGVGMKRMLTRPAALRAFNIAMALLLVASIAPMLMEHGKV
jgi:threonine/homoserine/homoserine lactone efflux protein